MALPSNVSYGKVSGRFISAVGDSSNDPDRFPDGIPVEGIRVEFRASVPMTKNSSATPPATIFLQTVVATTDAQGDLIDATGQKGIYLVATNDPDLNPTNFTYNVNLRGPQNSGLPDINFNFILPANAELDLTTIIPTPSTPGQNLSDWALAVTRTEAARDAAIAARNQAEQFATGGATANDAVIANAIVTNGTQTNNALDAMIAAAIATIPAPEPTLDPDDVDDIVAGAIALQSSQTRAALSTYVTGVVNTAIDNIPDPTPTPVIPTSVVVTTGSETRPSVPTSTVVLWFDTRTSNITTPTNMGPYDIHARQGAATPQPTAAAITSTSLGTITQNSPFSFTLERTGTDPITFSVTAGALPAGLTLNTSTGVISGTPTGTGSYTVTITPANGAGNGTARQFTGTVGSAAPVNTPPTITTTTLPSMTVGASMTQTIASTGSTPITYSVFSGQLPAGLSLNGAVISGTPTTAGSYSFTVRATNSAGVDDQVFAGTVAAPAGTAPTITTTSLPAMTQGVAMSQTIAATGSATITLSVLGGSLPAGLSLSGMTVSGTPTASGSYNFTLRATNSVGFDDQVYTGTVQAPATTPVGLSVFEDTVPTHTVLSDSTALRVGSRFYSPSKKLQINGVRVYEPADATVNAVSDLTVWAYLQNYTGGQMQVPTWDNFAATKTQVGGRTPGQWTEIMFDAPITLNRVSDNLADDVLLVAYQFGTSGKFLQNTDISGQDPRQSVHTDGVYLSENAAFNRSAYKYVNSASGDNSGVYYMVDFLYEVLP